MNRYRLFFHYCLILFIIIFQNPVSANAQSDIALPQPGTFLDISEPFTPSLLKGMEFDPQNPLILNFLIQANSYDAKYNPGKIETEALFLIKYFLGALTVPEEDLWVNLSPYEKDRVIPDALGKTDLGKILLEQDYLLKHLSASLMHPNSQEGREFWTKIYQSLYQKQISSLPSNFIHKIWIVPEQAQVYKDGNRVFIGNASLKILLEDDYLALKNQSRPIGTSSIQENMPEDMKLDIRSIIVPIIQKEVNHGRIFAPLRQIYQAVILAKWFKSHGKSNPLGYAYMNQNKIQGIDIDDKNIPSAIYSHYMQSFSQGIMDTLWEQYDPSQRNVTAYRYSSGGIPFWDMKEAYKETNMSLLSFQADEENFIQNITVRLKNSSDYAQLTSPQISQIFQNAASLSEDYQLESTFISSSEELIFQKSLLEVMNQDAGQFLALLNDKSAIQLNHKAIAFIFQNLFHPGLLKESPLLLQASDIKNIWKIYQNMQLANPSSPINDHILSQILVKIFSSRQVIILDDRRKDAIVKNTLSVFEDIIPNPHHVQRSAYFGILHAWATFFVKSHNETLVTQSIDLLRKEGYSTELIHTIFMPILTDEASQAYSYTFKERKTLGSLIYLVLGFHISQEIKTPQDAFEALFEDENIRHKFLTFASLLRKIYPFDLATEYPPLSYALSNEIYFSMGSNLYLIPLSQSFRRYLIICMDEAHNIKFVLNPKIPGEHERKYFVNVYKTIQITNKLKQAFPEKQYAVDIVGSKILQEIEDMYGKPIDFRSDNSGIIVFDYPEDGQRLEFVTQDNMNELAKRFNKISREELEVLMLKKIAEPWMAIHAAGYIGHYYKNQSIGRDMHIGNMLMSIVDDELDPHRAIRFRLVNDFQALTPVNSFQDEQQERDLDIEWMLYTNGSTPGLLTILTHISPGEVRRVFKDTYENFKKIMRPVNDFAQLSQKANASLITTMVPNILEKSNILKKIHQTGSPPSDSFFMEKDNAGLSSPPGGIDFREDNIFSEYIQDNALLTDDFWNKALSRSHGFTPEILSIIPVKNFGIFSRTTH